MEKNTTNRPGFKKYKTLSANILNENYDFMMNTASKLNIDKGKVINEAIFAFANLDENEREKLFRYFLDAYITCVENMMEEDNVDSTKLKKCHAYRAFCELLCPDKSF